MKRREIFIELTSMLDVILIILFVLLTQARTQTTDAIAEAEADRSRAAALEQALADSRAEAQALRSDSEALRREADSLQEQSEALREEAESVRRQLLSRGLVLENSLVTTVSVSGRTAIRVETDGGDTQSISYRWENDNYSRNALLSALRQALNAGEGRTVFLVFQYDRAAIYRAEYELIRNVLGEIKLDAKQREIPVSVLELDISE